MPFVANVDNVLIKRPDPSDIGGKKDHAILHDDLVAYFEERSELLTDREGSTRVITGLMLLPPRDRKQEQIDVQADDVIEFDDYRGVAQARTVVRATPEFDHLRRLDHLVVELD